MIIVLSHMGYAADKLLAANSSLSEIDLIVGAHSHTLLYGSPAPAGQPQLGSTPPGLLVTPATAESLPEGPYPTNILNGGKTIPVVQAFWGSRCVGCSDKRGRVQALVLAVLLLPCSKMILSALIHLLPSLYPGTLDRSLPRGAWPATSQHTRVPRSCSEAQTLQTRCRMTRTF